MPRAWRLEPILPKPPILCLRRLLSFSSGSRFGSLQQFCAVLCTCALASCPLVQTSSVRQTEEVHAADNRDVKHERMLVFEMSLALPP